MKLGGKSVISTAIVKEKEWDLRLERDYLPLVHKGEPCSIAQNEDNLKGSEADREGKKGERKERERKEDRVSPCS